MNGIIYLGRGSGFRRARESAHPAGGNEGGRFSRIQWRKRAAASEVDRGKP